MEKGTSNNTSGSQRHPDFAWVEKPFGIEAYIWNRVCQLNAHLFCFYYIYLIFSGKVPLETAIFCVIYAFISGFGVTIGLHRYWTHRSFKAKLPLQILLMILQSMASQWSIFSWCLDHRIHHQFVDTDADPHNSNRGFLFSHIVWLFVPRHPECKKKRMTFRMPDLENDLIVRFESRWHWRLMFIFHVFIPNLILHYFWKLPLIYCIACNNARWVLSQHVTFCVNSVAHKFGTKQYDRKASSVENALVSLFTGGEGWHNYHHAFPGDYRAAEFGWKINASTIVIDFFAWLGWAYDLKTVSPAIVCTKKEKLKADDDSSSSSRLIL